MAELPELPEWYVKVQEAATRLHLATIDYRQLRYPDWLYEAMCDSYGYAYVARHLERVNKF